MRKPTSSPSPVRTPETVIIDGTPYALRGAIVRPYSAKPTRLAGTISPELQPTTLANSERRGAMPASGSYFFPMRRGA